MVYLLQAANYKYPMQLLSRHYGLGVSAKFTKILFGTNVGPGA